MAFAIDDISPHVAEELHKETSLPDEATTVNRWIFRAIRAIQRLYFECWKEELSLSLTAGTYRYPYTSAIWGGAALVRPLRIDGNSFRYGSNPLSWRESIGRLDRVLGGPEWKDTASTGGTPRWVTEMAQCIIIGVKPDSDFVSDNPTLGGYYFRGEDLSDTSVDLKMYDDLQDYVIDLAKTIGAHQEDDNALGLLVSQWVQKHEPDMRAYDHAPREEEPIQPPSWGAHVYGSRATW